MFSFQILIKDLLFHFVEINQRTEVLGKKNKVYVIRLGVIDGIV